MAEWQANKAALDELDLTIISVSTDTKEQTREVMEKHGLTFPMAYGASPEDGAAIGAWWSDDHDGYIQPAEFLLGRGGVVLGGMYASGPIGRMGPEEAIRFITVRENRRREGEGA